MIRIPGLELTDHTFTVPLDHSRDDGPAIEVFAREAVAAGRWDLALWGILTSIVAVYYYLRLVVVMYMQPESAPGPGPAGPPHRPDDATAWTAPATILVAAAGIVLIGLFPETLLQQSALSIRALLGK